MTKPTLDNQTSFVPLYFASIFKATIISETISSAERMYFAVVELPNGPLLPAVFEPKGE